MKSSRCPPVHSRVVPRIPSTSIKYSAPLLGFRAAALCPLWASLMHRMTVVRPLLPAHIQLFCKESSLCQLQSHLCGQLSIVPPAVRDDFLVFRQRRSYLRQIFRRHAPCAGNMP